MMQHRQLFLFAILLVLLIVLFIQTNGTAMVFAG